MIKHLLKLSSILKNMGFSKLAQDVDKLTSSWDEPWHEEVVKEFGEEPISEEEYLEKEIAHAEPDVPEVLSYKIMQEEGFKPLMHGDSIIGAMIGMGSYGKVFRGSYNGKDAVMKVIGSVNDSGEVDNWKRIINAASGMPENLKRHIPVIYKTGEGSIKSPYEHEPNRVYNYEFIIMEPLFKLHKSIYNKIIGLIEASSSAKDIPKDSLYIFKDEEFLHSVANKIVDLYIYDEDADEERDLHLVAKIHKELLKLKLKNLLAEDSYEIKEIAAIIVNKIYGDKSIPNERIKLIQEDVEEDLYIFIQELVLNKGFPLYNPDIEDELDNFKPEVMQELGYWVQSPETKSFIEFLLYLYINHGIAWNDVHEDNIMMDKDGTLKLIDVGLF